MVKDFIRIDMLAGRPIYKSFQHWVSSVQVAGPCRCWYGTVKDIQTFFTRHKVMFNTVYDLHVL